jgi:hypothetical protein
MSSTSINTGANITDADIDELVALIIRLPNPDASKNSPMENIWKLHAVASTSSGENEWWDTIESGGSRHAPAEDRASLQRLRRNYNSIRKLQRLSQEVFEAQNFTPNKPEYLPLASPPTKRQRLSEEVVAPQNFTSKPDYLPINPQTLGDELEPSTYIDAPMQCGQSPCQEIQSLEAFGIKLTEQQEESLYICQNQLHEQADRLHMLRVNYMNEVDNMKLTSVVRPSLV